MNIRIIPRLDIKGPNLVKGIGLEGLRVLGKPEDFARRYHEQGADELVYQDAVASLYGRNSLLEIVERTAREIFIPLAVGGGLRSVDDMRRVLRAGADKVVVNTAAVANPELISKAAQSFGSSTVVVAVEAMRMPDATYEAQTNYGRDRTGKDTVALAGLLHYNFIRHHQNADKDYTAEGNIEFLKKGGVFSNIQDTTLAEVKAGLAACGIACRAVPSPTSEEETQ